MSGVTELAIRFLQSISSRLRPRKAAHLELGQRGEIEAYFYLTRLGYRIVARNFRVPYNHGEIDLIGWDNGVLCFIEVKTRTDDSFAPPSTAVTAKKRRNILAVARRYLRRLPGEHPPACRFDIVSVVPSSKGGRPQFTLRKGAFSWDEGRRRRREYPDYSEKRFWRRRY